MSARAWYPCLYPIIYDIWYIFGPALSRPKLAVTLRPRCFELEVGHFSPGERGPTLHRQHLVDINIGLEFLLQGLLQPFDNLKPHNHSSHDTSFILTLPIMASIIHISGLVSYSSPPPSTSSTLTATSSSSCASSSAPVYK